MYFFEETLNQEFCKEHPFILLINKIDLLKKKLKVIPFNENFPEYKGKAALLSSIYHNFCESFLGGPHNFEEVQSFILRSFLSLNVNSKILIYPYFTRAIDTDCMKSIFYAVSNIIVKNNLKKYSIL
jgi:hypothetical protein